MIQITAQSKIFLATLHVDFRKGIDALVAVCKQLLAIDPFSGQLFLFRNRSGTAIKILCYDGQGFWLCMKRFSQGKLNWWPTSSEQSIRLSHHQLQILLYNGNPTKAQIPPDWRKVA
jgi:transposase